MFLNKKTLQTAVLLFLHVCKVKNGGAGRDRTDDPQTASLMLSQLSYSPIIQSYKLIDYTS
jgi:hypothetical protein